MMLTVRKAPFSLFVALLLLGSCAKNPPVTRTSRATPMAHTAGPVCDDSLWDHVYVGDPNKFASAKDRLKVMTPCMTVTGTIFNAAKEKDGDFHIRLAVDSQFAGLLNEKNNSGQ